MDWEILRYIALAGLVLGAIGVIFSMGRHSGEERLRQRLREVERENEEQAKKEATRVAESNAEQQREREARAERFRRLRERDPN